MEKLFEVFRDSFPGDNPIALEPALEGNAAVALSDAFEDDLVTLKQQLAKKNIKFGKFLGAGSTAVIFELETMDGKKVDSVVLRIESKEGVGHSDHPIVRRSIAQLDGDFYTVQIMPRAERLTSEPTTEDYEKTLAALNAADYLQFAWDLKKDALMHMKKPNGGLVQYKDGTPVLIVADTNAVNTEGTPYENHLGVIAREFGMDEAGIKARKLPADEMAHLQVQMDEVYTAAEQKVKGAGIDLCSMQEGTDRSWRARTAGGQGWKLGS